MCDGCAEQYRCASTLYLMSVMSQCYSIIIDRDISAPRHEKELVDVLNAVDKRYIYQMMFDVQLPGSVRLPSHNNRKCMYQDTGGGKAISRQPIFLNESDYHYVLEEVSRQEKLSLKDM